MTTMRYTRALDLAAGGGVRTWTITADIPAEYFPTQTELAIAEANGQVLSVPFLTELTRVKAIGRVRRPTIAVTFADGTAAAVGAIQDAPVPTFESADRLVTWACQLLGVTPGDLGALARAIQTAAGSGSNMAVRQGLAAGIMRDVLGLS